VREEGVEIARLVRGARGGGEHEEHQEGERAGHQDQVAADHVE
jgi:hypothetical protein